MSSTPRSPADDPLYALPEPARPHYATGMLLDAGDFADEQTYHRNRLARALAFAAGAGARRQPPGGASSGAVGLHGGGTLAGARVSVTAAAGDRPEEVRVAPGLVVDRLGRLVEIPRAVCLRLQRWFDAELAGDGGDRLRAAALADPDRFRSPRMVDAGTAVGARAVVTDVFVRFVACRQGLTPAFASGPYDALDAATASRLRDAFEVQLVPRGDGLDDDFDGLPLLDPDLSALGPAARRDALQDAVLDAWPDLVGHTGLGGELPPPAGHPPGLDPTAVFLARLFLPVGAANPPARSGAALVDNGGRRVLPNLALLGGALGLGAAP